MFSLVITEKSGAQHQLDLDATEISIGRLDANDVCLPKTNVSKHHARLIFKDQRYVVVDQKSTNGTFVNGRRITGPTVLKRGDKIYIGEFILTLAAPANAAHRKGAGARNQPAAPNMPEASATLHDAGVGLPPELKRTKPERKSPAPSAAAAIGPTQAMSSTPPPLPRPSPPPPPLPRNGPTPADDALHGVTPPSGTSSSRPAPAARGEAGRRTNNASQAAAPSIPPLPMPALDQLAADGVDSAQGAALSGLAPPAALAPSVRLQSALSLLIERWATHMNLSRDEESSFPAEQEPVLDQLLEELSQESGLGPDIDRAFLREAAISEAVGLGPLDRLLANRAVREIVVDGPTRVLADLGGGLTPVASFFSDDSAVKVVARRLLHRAGQKLDEAQMVHEAQLPGGGWLQVLLPPLSPKGPLISIRCPVRAQSSPESFVSDGLLSNEMLNLLRTSLSQRKNVLVFGALGAGVSQLLGLLTRLAPEHERIVAIEYTPSTSLINPQVLPLSRRALPSAKLDDLLRRAALLRYDRLVIDDLAPTETFPALFAAAGGGGVVLGMHAPTAAVALSLLEHGTDGSVGGNANVPAPLIAAALQLLIHVGEDPSGTRRIQSISELRLTPPSTLEVRTLFRHDGKGFVASFLGR